MKKETKKKIMLWTFGMLFLVGVMMVAIGSNYNEQYEEEVKCYDRYSNEIEDLICTELKTDFSILSIGGFVIVGIFEILFMIILLGYNLSSI